MRIEGLSDYLKGPGLLLTFNLGSCGMGGGKEKIINDPLKVNEFNLITKDIKGPTFCKIQKRPQLKT